MPFLYDRKFLSHENVLLIKTLLKETYEVSLRLFTQSFRAVDMPSSVYRV